MRPNHPIRTLTAVILLGTAALSATAALAAEPPTMQSRSINYVRAELSDPAAAQALYEHIQRAARIVCEQPDVRELDRYSQFKRCYQNAVDAAVANVDATSLTALHRSKAQRAAAG